MSSFWKTLLLGVVAYFIVGRIPVINGILGWAVLVLVGVYFVRSLGETLRAKNSPVGYGLGMGALLGLIVNVVGVLLNIVLALVMLSAASSAAQANPGNVGTAAAGLGAAYSGASNFVHLLFAPVVGAFFGGLGGLVGSAALPKNTSVSG